MKLFLKDNLALILLQATQLLLMLFITWLDGYRDFSIILYALFLNFFLFTIYLLFRYRNQRLFYKRLADPLTHLNQSLEKTGTTPLPLAFDNLLKSQFILYVNKIEEIEAEKANHLNFIDRWVHQMKTPLSVIELTAEQLDEPDSSNIREETERMQASLRTILYMARLRTIKEDLNIKRVRLMEVIRSVNGELKRFYIRNNVYPRFKNIKNDAVIETDEKWLYFIIMQLLQNAVKYSAGKSNEIEINIYEKKGSYILEIQDYGIGIPLKDQKRIFQPFFTGENGRKYQESTGMGLYLVKEVIDYLGYGISVESIVDEGTTFQITFSANNNLTAS